MALTVIHKLERARLQVFGKRKDCQVVPHTSGDLCWNGKRV
jgi:hypothetical protein